MNAWKRILILSLALALTLALSACGGKKQEAGTTAPETEQVAPPGSDGPSRPEEPPKR